MKIKLLLLALMMTGCATGARVIYFKVDGVNWRCEHNTIRMQCHNTDHETRYLRKRPVHPREY